uniref:Peptidase family M13 n=1 Tax=Plectus sambesii TaxID=2011161 RepID=A0A914XPP0_9BILA
DLSPNKPMRHTIGDVTARVNKQVKSLLEAPHDPTDKPWDRLAKSYYQKCLQEEVLDQNGISALVMILNELGGWPVLEGDMWQPWTHSWEQQLALLINRTGINAVVLEFAVGHDPKNSSTTVIEIDQPKWGIGTRWPYLSGADDPMIKNYTQLMIEIAIGIGADPAIAARDMREAVELEVKLVNFSADEQMRRDADRVYNPFQLYQLAEIFPYVDLEEYVRTIFRDSVDITLNDTVIVREVEYIRGIQHVMQSSSKRTIANYLLWRSVQGFSPFLPPWLREPFYKFRANQTGIFTNTPPERWEDCVTLSVMMLDMPVGKLFVQHFFDKEKAMTKMDELTLYLKETFIEELHNIDWMDDKTKQRAVDKANFIEYKSGYPPWLFNDTWMQDNWGLTPTNRTEPLLHLTIRLKLSRVRDELVRFKQTVDRSVWYQGPAQVDAYYAPNLNQMIFPAGIMQFPFLTIGVPNYVTFGMAGAVVGHEVSHAFDDQGGRYDEFGNLEDWWARETAVKFYEKTECFVKQYESISVPEAGIRLNGRMSLGENIADNGGVKTAYMAYNKWLESSGGVEPALPGLQNFTSDQLFFLAYANVSFVLLSSYSNSPLQL